METDPILEPSLEDHDGSRYGAVISKPRNEVQGNNLVDSKAPNRLWNKMFPYGYCDEFKGLLILAWPMILTQLSQFFIPPTALIFCGHLGKKELDAVALANSMINVTGLSVAVGLSAACDTLFSQIYGSPNKLNLGIALQKSILILLLAAFLCLAIHVNTELFLRTIGQDAQVARLAGQYILIFIPGLLSFFVYIALSKYIQNQNIVMPNLVIGLIANCVNVLAHYLLIYVVKMSPGTVGSAISQVLSYLTMLVLTIVYICASGVYKETWCGWSTECLQDWATFFKLAISGLLMVCIEWWSFEVGVFLSGILGTTELGAQSVLFQMESLTFMLPLGLGISVSIRLGQHLGSGNAKRALTTTRVAISMICVSGLAAGLILTGLRDYLPQIFTNVSDVVELASKTLPILGLYMVFDSIAGVGSGILKGSGRQKTGAVIIFFVYACALSAGIPLMFLTSLGIAGLWWPLAIGIAAESFVLFFIIILTDWEKEVEKARERTKAEEDTRREIIRRTAAKMTSSSNGQHKSTMTDGHVTSNFEEEDVKSHERTHLISETDDELPPPIDSASCSSSALLRSHDNTQYHDLVVPNKIIPLKEIALPRLTAVFIVLAIFGAGLVIRFTVPIPAAPLCLPTHTTVVNSSLSLPYCDDT